MTEASRWTLVLGSAWLFALTGAVSLGRAVYSASRGPRQVAEKLASVELLPAQVHWDVTDALVDSIIDRDPFMLQASDELVGGPSLNAVGQPRPMPSAPPIRVQAIVGPPWRALVAISSAEPQQVAPGDSAFGWLVQSVNGTTVKLKGRDSLLVLSLRSMP